MQVFNIKEFVTRNEIKTSVNPVSSVIKMLSPLVDDGTWLAGGAMLALVTNDKVVKDYDLFFRNKDSLRFTEENIKASGGVLVLDSDNALTYELNGFIIQLIDRRYYSSVEEVLLDFDFTICMIGYDFNNNLFFGDYTLYDVAKNKLQVGRINSIGHTMKRLVKYGAKGYHGSLATYEDVAKFLSGVPAEVLAKSVALAGTNGNS